MISIEAIKVFCSVDSTRGSIMRPGLVGGKVVATDGRVIVEVAVEEISPESLAGVEWSENFPDYVKHLGWEGHWREALTPFEMPPVPPKVSKMVECDCEGGKDEFGDTCENCDGKGSWEDLSGWRVEGSLFAMAGHLVSRVLTLPGVRWYEPAFGSPWQWVKDPFRFCFGETGRGLLMPLRKATGAEVSKGGGSSKDRKERRKDSAVMIKHPLNPQFNAAVLSGRKFTTIRDKPWPVWADVMLYNWTGAPYRSKQRDVAAVIVESETEIIISNDGHTVTFYPENVDGISLHETEGFDSLSDLQSWFGRLVKPGEMVTKYLMRFRLAPKN